MNSCINEYNTINTNSNDIYKDKKEHYPPVRRTTYSYKNVSVFKAMMPNKTNSTKKMNVFFNFNKNHKVETKIIRINILFLPPTPKKIFQEFIEILLTHFHNIKTAIIPSFK